MRAFLCFLLCLFAVHSWAGTTISDSNTNLALSVGGSAIKYSETIGDSESGTVPAVGISGSVQASRFFLSDDFTYARGIVNYNGYVQHLFAPNTPLSFSRDMWWYDNDLKLGVVAVKDSDFQLTPYGLFAYHHWERPIYPGGDITGYNEDYHHFGVGAGLLLQWSAGDWITAIDGNVYEVVSPHLVIAGLPMNLSTFNMKDQVGEQLSLKVNRLFGKQSLFFVVGVNRFQYGQSQMQYFMPNPATVSIMYEPKSTTTESSFRIGWAF